MSKFITPIVVFIVSIFFSLFSVLIVKFVYWLMSYTASSAEILLCAFFFNILQKAQADARTAFNQLKKEVIV